MHESRNFTRIYRLPASNPALALGRGPRQRDAPLHRLRPRCFCYHRGRAGKTGGFHSSRGVFIMEMAALPLGSRRNEDIALDLMKFIAMTTGYGKTTGAGVGFQGGGAAPGRGRGRQARGIRRSSAGTLRTLPAVGSREVSQLLNHTYETVGCFRPSLLRRAMHLTKIVS